MNRHTIILSVFCLLTAGLGSALATSQGTTSLTETTLADDQPPDWAVEQQEHNLETARAILDRVDQAGDDPMTLAQAVELAELGTRHQVATLGLEWTEPASSYDHASPSQALFELAERHGAELTGEQVERVEALDELPVDVRDALTRFVDAFLVLEDATAQAYEGVDLEALDGLEAELEAGDVAMAASNDDEAPWQGLLAEAGVDLAPVFPARSALLAATVDLEQALATSPGVTTTSAAGPIVVAPAFAIDVDGTASTYTEDVALSVDVGGDDTYHNNAGGSNLAGGSCTLTDPGVVGTAATLVDFGSGVDTYGSSTTPTACGANGGGHFGVGSLVDAGGSDAYSGGSSGTNGGGSRGVGLLVDAGGSDTYSGGWYGTNGGALYGVGSVLDVVGNDGYSGGSVGVNGGGRAGGVGVLVDVVGGDAYSGGSDGVNGGGLGGTGFLLDGGGDDGYIADSAGVNGGTKPVTSNVAHLFGLGILVDAGGTDSYTDNAGGSGTDKTVVPKGLVGAQLDVVPAIVPALPAPGFTDNPDGTCTIYDDADGDGQPGSDESIASPPCPDPAVASNPDGSTTIYDDRNDNGAKDSGEGLATIPPPPSASPDVTDNPDGSCTVYDDRDGDGFADEGETAASFPCPEPALEGNGDGSYTVYDDKDDDGSADAGEEVVSTPPADGNLSVSLPDAAADEEVPGVTTPGVPERNVSTPPVEVPFLCAVDLCQEETELVPGQDVSIPGVPSMTVTTPEVPVPETCTPEELVCVGPFSVPPQSVGPTPGVPGRNESTPPVVAPPACQEVEPVCLGPITLLPSRNETIPGVPPVEVTPPVRVQLVFGGLDATVDPKLGQTDAVGPFEFEPEVPVIGPVPITVCGQTCPVPKVPAFGADTEVSVVVFVGEEVYRATVPISISQQS